MKIHLYFIMNIRKRNNVNLSFSYKGYIIENMPSSCVYVCVCTYYIFKLPVKYFKIQLDKFSGNLHTLPVLCIKSSTSSSSSSSSMILIKAGLIRCRGRQRRVHISFFARQYPHVCVRACVCLYECVLYPTITVNISSSGHVASSTDYRSRRVLLRAARVLQPLLLLLMMLPPPQQSQRRCFCCHSAGPRTFTVVSFNIPFDNNSLYRSVVY